MINNPFDITKAVDYTDEEILKYWVDLDGDGFKNIMKPNSAMPIIIKGSKGSGKTHIMKYYSYELQKIRSKVQGISLKDFLEQDKFLGVYIRCSGFNAEQFAGKGVSKDIWQALYSYFWELWIGERVTSLLIDLREKGVLSGFDEPAFIVDVLNLFLQSIKCEYTLDALRELFLTLQKSVLYEVQNFIFTNQSHPQIQILLALNSVTYGLPNLLSSTIPFFRDKRIVYLIDELENFSVSQQELVQSLLREKPITCTFRIGARPYGLRTYKTLGAIEENHEGEEFEMRSLDEELRGNERYEEYVTKICANRIRHSALDVPEQFIFSDLIETQSNDEILQIVYSKKESQSRSYFKRLVDDIKTYVKSMHLQDIDTEEILRILSFPDNPIVERTNIYLMYRRLKEGRRNLLNEAKIIRQSAFAYNKDKSIATEHTVYLDKYKQDVIDTITKEGRVAIPYNGLNRLIALSCGTPRTILRLLKTAFNKQYFNTGKQPFVDGRKLSAAAQNEAIKETSEWFFEENRIPSSAINRPSDAVIRLGNYLQSMRFADLPPQCSINVFSIDMTRLSEVARETFDSLIKYSFVIKAGERREKNSDNKEVVYQLNNILIPKWELALGKRGVVDFSPEEANFILEESKRDEYDEFKKEKMKKYNFPFDRHENQHRTLKLF